MLVNQNTTHFTPEELQRLLAAFKRVALGDRLQGTQFYDVVSNEMGWSNLLLRKQLFQAFDREGRGELDFRAFAQGYSAMLRGTVPELVEFSWRLYKVTVRISGRISCPSVGPPPLHHPWAPGLLQVNPLEVIQVSDIYLVLKLALGGLEEVRRKQGKTAGGAAEDTRQA